MSIDGTTQFDWDSQLGSTFLSNNHNMPMDVPYTNVPHSMSDYNLRTPLNPFRQSESLHGGDFDDEEPFHD